MKIHFGAPKRSMEIVSHHAGYHFQAHGENVARFIPYAKPKLQERYIKAMYGVSIGSAFFGVIVYSEGYWR